MFTSIAFVAVVAVVADVAEPADVAKVAVAALPPMLRAAAVPVILVPTRTVGVSRFGDVRVGLEARTKVPVPVPVYSALVR
mgnify:CR=1 FL=1